MAELGTDNKTSGKGTQITQVYVIVEIKKITAKGIQLNLTN